MHRFVSYWLQHLTEYEPQMNSAAYFIILDQFARVIGHSKNSTLHVVCSGAQGALDVTQM